MTIQEQLNGWISEAERMEKDRNRMALLISRIFHAVDIGKVSGNDLIEAAKITHLVEANGGQYC